MLEWQNVNVYMTKKEKKSLRNEAREEGIHRTNTHKIRLHLWQTKYKQKKKWWGNDDESDTSNLIYETNHLQQGSNNNSVYPHSEKSDEWAHALLFSLSVYFACTQFEKHFKTALITSMDFYIDFDFIYRLYCAQKNGNKSACVISVW